MKNISLKLFATITLVLFGTIGIVNFSDAAGWTMVHGSGAVVQDPSDAQVRIESQYLRLQLNPGQSTWIHVSIPTPPQSEVSKAVSIRMEFGMDAGGPSVTAIHVYNGPAKVKEIQLSSSVTGPMALRTFSLGELPIAFPYGMNIAIQVKGGGRGPQAIRFASAGAYWLGTVP